jgi:hypothetical protein
MSSGVAFKGGTIRPCPQRGQTNPSRETLNLRKGGEGAKSDPRGGQFRESKRITLVVSVICTRRP